MRWLRLRPLRPLCLWKSEPKNCSGRWTSCTRHIRTIPTATTTETDPNRETSRQLLPNDRSSNTQLRLRHPDSILLCPTRTSLRSSQEMLRFPADISPRESELCSVARYLRLLSRKRSPLSKVIYSCISCLCFLLLVTFE